MTLHAFTHPKPPERSHSIGKEPNSPVISTLFHSLFKIPLVGQSEAAETPPADKESPFLVASGHLLTVERFLGRIEMLE